MTSDKSGFGQWILSNFINSISACGVKVVGRTDSNYHEAAGVLADQIVEYAGFTEEERKVAARAAYATSERADWKFFISAYDEAFATATRRRDERIND